MHVVPTPVRTRSICLVVSLLLLPAAVAQAVVRSCDPNDPVGNTTNVICVDAGACTPTSVTVTQTIDVTDGVGCAFDAGGRDFVVNATFSVTGQGVNLNGFIKVMNADDITITSLGKLKARGDFVEPFAFILGGGLISLEAAGSVLHAGLIDVTGDSAGTVNVTAGGDVTFASGSEVRGNGLSSLDEGQRFADGAELDVTAGGNIDVEGDLTLEGQDQGAGGIVGLTAARNVTVNRKIDAVGGGSDGGEVSIDAGDHVLVAQTIDVTSELGGGSGGDIVLEAGSQELGGGIVPGGHLDVNNAVLKAQGSSGDEGFAGDGGTVDVSAAGKIRFFGASVAVRLDAATSFDAAGGDLIVDSGDADPGSIGPLDGDIELGGVVTGASGNVSGEGGSVLLSAGRDLTVTAGISLNGRSSGGEVSGEAGRSVTVSGTITAEGTSATAPGGDIDFTAGQAAIGTLSLTASIDAVGGTNGSPGQGGVLLAGCFLTVAPGVHVDGRGGPGGSGPSGANLDLVSLHPMSLGSNSQYLAGPGGSITLHHPVGAPPVVGSGVTFDPAVDLVVGPTNTYLNCPGCGNGILEAGEACDDGNAVSGDCCSASCTIESAGTVCRPPASYCDAPEMCNGSSPTCPADTMPVTDHYVLYKAKASPRVDLPNGNKFPKKDWNLKLNDRALDDGQPDDPENYQVKKEKSLLLPAMKNDESGPVDPDLHYVRYQIKEAKEGAGPFDPGSQRYPGAVKHVKGRVWMLANQFGTINVTTKKVEAMLVPAAKSFASQPPAPADATHYICYQAKETGDVTGQTPDTGSGSGKFRKDLEAFFGDQFEDCALDRSGEVSFAGTPVEGKCLLNLKKVKSLCNPIDKSDVGGAPPRVTIAPPGSVSTPDTCRSLLCYQVKLSSRVLSHAAATLAGLSIDASLSQSGHLKHALFAGNAPFTTPGNNFPAPLQMDTKKTELVCIPTDVTSVVSP
jgi:cysteine-rich repeat protein